MAGSANDAQVAKAPLWQRALAIVVWVAIWQLLAQVTGARFAIAGPLQTFARLAELVTQHSFWASVGTTLAHVVLAYVASFVVGCALGAVAHARRSVGTFLAPLMSAIKAVPVACVVVLLLMLAGSAHVSAAVVVLVVLPATYHATLEGLGNQDGRVDEALRQLGVRPTERALAVRWPDLVGFLVASASVSVGMAWKAAVAAELIGMPLTSVGERIYQAKVLFETADLFAWTLVVVLLAAASERIFLTGLRGSAALSRRCSVLLSARRRPEPCEPAALEAHGLSLVHGSCAGKFLDVSVRPGERVVLADPSGAGKTTLLRKLSVTSGLRCSSSYQEPLLVDELDALDNLVLACGGARSRDELAALLRELVGECGTGTRAGSLSGGERRRVDVARALVCPSQAVLLDEPFAGLDAGSRVAVAALVERLLDDRPLLVASHVDGTSDLLRASSLTLRDLAGDPCATK